MIGAVIGTIGGYEARTRLVAANGGRDRPIAVAEDVVAAAAGVAIAYATSVCLIMADSPPPRGTPRG